MTNNQASETINPVYLKKRELVAYYLLCSNENTWNIGDAVDFLVSKLCLSKKTAYNIFRRLRRLGLLRRQVDLVYKCVPFKVYIERIVEDYVYTRSERGCG